MMDEEGGIATPRSLINEYCAIRYKKISQNTIDLIFFQTTNSIKQ